MDEKMFPTASADDRLQMLEDNCDGVEDLRYFKQYTQKELAGKKDEMTELAIDLHDLDTERKEFMDDWKIRKKPKKLAHQNALEILRLKGEEVKERTFKFVDHESREVGYYNMKGQLISQRKMMPNEGQMTITRAINS